jgi:proteic killer suppression protein
MATGQLSRYNTGQIKSSQHTRNTTLGVNNAECYYVAVIKTFKCADTEALFKRQRIARFVNIETVARRKLEQLNQAGHLNDLRVPPGNRLETLEGDRTGQHSIRVNDQFRVCFRWTGTDAEDVEIVDYH